MPGINLSNTQIGTALTATTINSMSVDSTTSSLDETKWMNSNASEQWGFFNSVPDLKSALLMKAIFNVGKGWKADTRTTVILEHISGWGKDSFRDILFNMEVCRKVFGDSFAEIIRDEETNILLNLKPLNPERMEIITGKDGLIKRYDYHQADGNIKKFEPKDIFHLCNNRMCDQIHGISDISVLKETILADAENFKLVQQIMRNQAMPFIIWKLKTDDPTKIAVFKSNVLEARKIGVDMCIPDDDDTVTHEVVELVVSANIFAWRDELRNRFYRTIQLPQIVPGAGGNSTESESKTIYYSFEQICQNEQNFLESQIWNQLFIHIDLIPPETMGVGLQQDTAKDGE